MTQPTRRLSKEEIAEELAHEDKMLRALRKTLRIAEEQASAFGLKVPLDLANNIEVLSQHVRDRERRIDELQIRAVEEGQPYEEVEFRAELAAAWEPGAPTVAGAARLAAVRLRLHVPSGVAAIIEAEVRAQLAEEAFNAIDKRLWEKATCEYTFFQDDLYLHIRVNELFLSSLTFAESFEASYRELGRAIRLDPVRTGELLLAKIPASLPQIERVTYLNNDKVENDEMDDVPEHLRPGKASPFPWYEGHFRHDFLIANNTEQGSPLFEHFIRFFEQVDIALKERQGVVQRETSRSPKIEDWDRISERDVERRRRKKQRDAE